MARTEAFNRLWASIGEKTPFEQFVQRARTGWEDGQDKDAPLSGIQNAWQARADVALQGLERKGAMDWSAAAVYGVGAPVVADDGQYYESAVDDNTGNNPVSTNGFWKLIGNTLFGGFSPGDYKFAAYSTNPPSGWLKAAGQAVSRSMYPRLFAAIGTTYNLSNDTDNSLFRLPDARGMFFRGADDGRGIDPGRVFGAMQSSQNLAHTHTGNTTLAGEHTHTVNYNMINYTGMSGAGGGDAFQNTPATTIALSAGAHIHGLVIDQSGGTEARPVNMTVQVLIKT